jgi:hypothetical protein
MDEMNQVTEWLESHKNQSCSITKHEDGDIDEVHMYLHKISLAEVEGEDPEEYVSNKSLMLQGEGTINSGDHDAPLPFDVYEIPITDKLYFKQLNNELQINTERAIYKIRIIH